MAKTEWGTKRVCLSCSAKFYDLSQDPMTCPSCGATFKPDDFTRGRRSKAAPVAEKPAPKPKRPKPSDDDDDDVLLGDDDNDDDDLDDDDDDDVIEDTSDLGDDDDDVPVVGVDSDDDDKNG